MGDDFSRLDERTKFLEKEVGELKNQLHEQKGFVEGRLSIMSQDIKEISKELTNKIEAGMKELKDMFKDKDRLSDNKKLILGCAIISPIVYVGLEAIVQHFFK